MKTDLQAHFGLSGMPFTRELPVSQRWQHAQFVEARDALLDVVESRQSAALISPPGTGKSQVLRAVVDGLPEARYRVTVVKVNGLSKRDFCRHLAASVGAKAAGHTAALVRNLQDHVQSIVSTEGRRPVLVLDEAHDLRGDVLSMLRLLTNFELDSRLVLSVILAGQPELRTMLRRDDQEAVRGRIACYCGLRLLSREESRSYIKHRLHIVGADTELLAKDGYEAVFECARGNLRAIDRITLAALKLAAKRGDSIIDAQIVIDARQTVMP